MDFSRNIANALPSAEEIIRALGAHTRNAAQHLPSADELLRSVGLPQRRSAASDVVPSVALFGAGLLVGAGLALLFAPTTGRELREELGEKAAELRDRATQVMESASEPGNGGA